VRAEVDPLDATGDEQMHSLDHISHRTPQALSRKGLLSSDIYWALRYLVWATCQEMLPRKQARFQVTGLDRNLLSS